MFIILKTCLIFARWLVNVFPLDTMGGVSGKVDRFFILPLKMLTLGTLGFHWTWPGYRIIYNTIQFWNLVEITAIWQLNTLEQTAGHWTLVTVNILKKQYLLINSWCDFISMTKCQSAFKIKRIKHGPCSTVCQIDCGNGANVHRS